MASSITSKRSETIIFRKDVADGATNWIPERVKANGMVKGIRARFYPGQQNTLKIMVYLERRGEVPVPLITIPAGGDQFLSGDDDYFVLAVKIPVQTSDYIKIYYANTNGHGFVYTVHTEVDIDYDDVIGGVA